MHAPVLYMVKAWVSPDGGERYLRWLEAGDIGQEETLAEVAERAGLARAEFLAALREARYEAALERSNEDARAEGVFGFPFFIYEGKRFWGNDRIEWLVREIKKI